STAPAPPRTTALSLHDALPISERGQDAAEDERVRHLQHEPQEAGEHQHVDENIGSESEKRVPVACRPQHRALYLGCGRRHHLLRSEEHTSELQSPYDLVCRLLL